MRQLVLVGVLLGAASSPARDARTSFNVGAYVVESCEVSTPLMPNDTRNDGRRAARSDARCAAAASRELRLATPAQASVSSDGSARSEAMRTSPPAAASARDASSTATRILLIRF